MASQVFRKLQVHKISSVFRQATKIVEVPLVPPKTDEIRIKNIYAGVNATDINITSARYQVDGKVPYDIGMEGLGIVDSIGSAVSGSLKVGQPVLVVDPIHNMFSEYLYKDPASLVPLPALKPNFLVANVNGLTGSIGLDKAGRVQKGETVLITAAAGGTGQIAVQWAKHRGCHVIGLTSTEEKARFIRELGADEVINYKEGELGSGAEGESGIDVVWETMGGDTFKVLLKNLSVKGRVVIIGSTTTYQGEGFADVPIPKLNAKLLMKSQQLCGFGVFHWWSDFDEYLPQLIDMISKDKLIARVDCGDTSPGGKFIGIEQMARAQEWLHEGKNQGKVVVQLHDL
ncbi:Prostaglandin reductase 3 [Tyrophagus putrescentiae]|nr:Prostaglandin reductase 3 [Tyrophagus putrescentiae]